MALLLLLFRYMEGSLVVVVSLGTARRRAPAALRPALVIWRRGMQGDSSLAPPVGAYMNTGIFLLMSLLSLVMFLTWVVLTWKAEIPPSSPREEELKGPAGLRLGDAVAALPAVLEDGSWERRALCFRAAARGADVPSLAWLFSVGPPRQPLPGPQLEAAGPPVLSQEAERPPLPLRF